MRLLTISSLLFALLMTFASNSSATDIENGKELHQQNCVRCHSAEAYTSESRKVMDKKALATRVKQCDYALGTQLFDEDIADIVAYLNKEYYHFD